MVYSRLVSLTVGAMPSPSMSQVSVKGVTTDWLRAPDTVLSVPRSIPDGSTVGVDGKIVLKIKTPTAPPTSESFKVQDGVGLTGFMSGIDRLVPSFHSPTKILFQHPITVDQPKFLKCAAPGQKILIKSRVR
jgi:hypothetical protein